jgi:hypothetical protein
VPYLTAVCSSGYIASNGGTVNERGCVRKHS